MTAVHKLRDSVDRLGMVTCIVSAFGSGLPASDRQNYPIYATAAELNLPVVIYSAMNYRTDLPHDVAHPRYLDQVARDFPQLKIIVTCGGWPWINEMVAIARRHANIFIDTSSHRPKYLAKAGSGWEMFLQFGNSLLQDQILFASGAADIGAAPTVLVEEALELPFKPEVKEKWLYKNAKRLFDA